MTNRLCDPINVTAIWYTAPAMEERGQLRWIVGFVEGEEQILRVPLLDG